MSWLSELQPDMETEPEFQRQECHCADCRTGGAYGYAHGHAPVGCIWSSKAQRDNRGCKVCARQEIQP